MESRDYYPQLRAIFPPQNAQLNDGSNPCVMIAALHFLLLFLPALWVFFLYDAIISFLSFIRVSSLVIILLWSHVLFVFSISKWSLFPMHEKENAFFIMLSSLMHEVWWSLLHCTVATIFWLSEKAFLVTFSQLGHDVSEFTWSWGCCCVSSSLHFLFFYFRLSQLPTDLILLEFLSSLPCGFIQGRHGTSILISCSITLSN